MLTALHTLFGTENTLSASLRARARGHSDSRRGCSSTRARSCCIQEPGCIQVLPNTDQVKRIRNLDALDRCHAGARGPGCSTATLVTVLKDTGAQFGRPHNVLQPELLTKMPKTWSCHQAFFVGHFLQSDKEGTNILASQHKDLQPQQAPILHHHPPLAAGLHESPEAQRNQVSFSEPARSEQQSLNSPSVPWRGMAAEAGAACSSKNAPAGRHRLLNLHGSIPVGVLTHGLGRAVPAFAGPQLPEQGALPPRVPPAPASCRDTPGWLLRGATIALSAQARSCRMLLGSCRLSTLPGHHYSLNTSCLLPCQPHQRLWLAAGGLGRQSSELSEHRSQSELPRCLPGRRHTDTAGNPLHRSRTLCQEDIPGSLSSLQIPHTSCKSVPVLWGHWLRTSGNARHDGGNSRGRGAAQALDGSL